MYIRQLPGGGGEVRVSMDRGYAPVWAPDGRELFFHTPDSMYVVPVSLGSRVVVGTPRALFALRGGLITSPTRQSYDALPGGRELVMFARPDVVGDARPPLVVRLNWTAALQSGQRPARRD